jgi:hypothetical protein
MSFNLFQAYETRVCIHFFKAQWVYMLLGVDLGE